MSSSQNKSVHMHTEHPVDLGISTSSTTTEPKEVVIICEIGKDLGDPLLDPDLGLISKLIGRFTNWLRRHSD